VGTEVLTARDRKTLVFTPTVALAEDVAAEFVGAGISAAMVSGETPTDQRRQLLRDFAAGRITVLANCAVLTEGYDEPGVQCVVIARPTKSRALYTQMVGRGTRRHPDKAECLVLDVVDASAEHSLVTVPSLFGIDKKLRDYTDGEPIARAVGEQEQELVRLGRLRAEEADLFAKVRREGLAWVAIHRDGDDLRRYVLSLGKGPDDEPLPLVVLAQRVPSEDVWTAGLQWPDGTKKALMVEVSMETAQGVAEDYVRKAAPSAARLTDANAAWRKGKPSPKALNAARKWHLAVDKGWNAGQLSDALNAHIARIKAKPRKAAKP
jgi:ATP-dependent helicase IRC3